MLTDLVNAHEMRVILGDFAKQRLDLLFRAMRIEEASYKLEKRARRFRRMAEELGSKMCECSIEIEAMEIEDSPEVSYG